MRNSRLTFIEVAELGPTENQNRFHRTLLDFISVFAQEGHPLVIVLDDLQWADVPTLSLIEMLMKNPETTHLFIIGAYRDNEVSSTHPLTATLKSIESVHPIKRISLEPLGIYHINEMISDSLKCPLDGKKN